MSRLPVDMRFIEVFAVFSMLTEIYWIRLDQPGAIGVMPRPRGGDWLEDEIANLCRLGVTTLVSLLEVRPLV